MGITDTHLTESTPTCSQGYGVARWPGCFVPVFEKQKIKMPKMAAVAAIFDIFIFCFSRIPPPPPPAPPPALLAWLQVGQSDEWGINAVYAGSGPAGRPGRAGWPTGRPASQPAEAGGSGLPYNAL